MIKYLGVLGGKAQVKSLGGFMIVVFGVVDFFLEVLSSVEVQPEWLLWFFRGGAILGLVLLIAGIFASDVSNHIKKPFSE